MIVDMLHAVVPHPDCAGALAARYSELVGYKEHFQRDPGYRSPRDEAELVAEMRADREAARARPQNPTAVQAALDDAGVGLAVMFAQDDPLPDGPGNIAELVAEFCAGDPDRYVGMCFVDPEDSDLAGRVDYLVQELGIGIISLGTPCLLRNANASDPRLAPVYERCQALGVPVSLGSAVNWYRNVPYDLFHPRYIDAVASSFPDLKIIASHAAWPWVMDMVMIAWRHRHIYLDLSTQRAGQFTNPALGWGPLLHFGDRVIADRVMFGSGGVLSGRMLGELIDEVRALPLKPANIDNWLGLNAARLLGRA